MPQPKLHWSAYLWPGLPHLWVRGSWVGLVLAVGFTALANFLLASSLVWSEWLPVRIRWIGLAVLTAIWMLAWAEARADWRRWLAQWSVDGELSAPERAEQLLADAQQSYLAGDWVVAEQTLRHLLRSEPRDVEARLMLATMWRHQGRWPEAEEYLGKLERAEASAPWAFEILRERQLLEQARNSANKHQTSARELRGEASEVELDRGQGVDNTEQERSAETEHSELPTAREERLHKTTEEPAWKRAA